MKLTHEKIESVVDDAGAVMSPAGPWTNGSLTHISSLLILLILEIRNMNELLEEAANAADGFVKTGAAGEA